MQFLTKLKFFWKKPKVIVITNDNQELVKKAVSLVLGRSLGFQEEVFITDSHKIADLHLQNKEPGFLWRCLEPIAYFLLFRPLKDRLGLSNVRFAVTGSSVLSLDTFRFIHAIGIELRQNYASTEAGFISSHGEGEIAYESVGRPALGHEGGGVSVGVDEALQARGVWAGSRGGHDVTPRS